MEVKEKWWVVDIEGKEHCLSYRNPSKLERYLIKVFKTKDVKLIRQGTCEDYYNFHNLINDVIER
jgi:hypothetical protein